MILVTCTACRETFGDDAIMRGTVRWSEGKASGVCHRCASQDIDSILTARELRFCDGVILRGLDGRAAAEAAGYLHPDTDAERLLKMQRIMAALVARRRVHGWPVTA